MFSKALQKGLFGDGWVGEGGPEPYFFRKLAVTVDSLGFFWPILVRFQTFFPPPPLPGALLGGGGIFGVEVSKNYVAETFGTVGELYVGKIMKNWGTTLLLIRSYREC